MKMKLLWPVDGNQSVALPYSAGSIEIAAVQGTLVRAVMEGTITNASDEWLQISAPEAVVVYTGVHEIRVQDSQSVTAGMLLAQVGPDGKIGIRVYQPVDPSGFFEAPVAQQVASTAVAEAIASAEAAQAGNLLLTPTMDGLRIREAPIDGKPVGTLKLDEIVESLEAADATKAKLGVENAWLHIRRADGTSAYTAAWLLHIAEAPKVTRTAGSLLGLNLDIFHPQGRPDPAAIQGVGWVRVKFNVSFNPQNSSHGNRDIEAAYQRYLPHIQRYAQGGLKILMVFTHQLYGEGAGFNWTQMDSGRWQQLVPTYADFARQVAAKFDGTDLIHAYQIWNEQDTRPEHARAAVPIPAADYGYMLTETIRAIRQVDKTTPIITGGHTTGPGPGSTYAKATLSAMPPDVRPDGVAFHPYGRGVKGHRFSNWGPLSEEIEAYSEVLPGKPLWITEWGVLDHQGRADVIDDVCDYCGGFMDILKKEYPGKVAAAIWYAWADGMDNGFGLVDQEGKPKPTIYDQWRALG